MLSLYYKPLDERVSLIFIILALSHVSLSLYAFQSYHSYETECNNFIAQKFIFRLMILHMVLKPEICVLLSQIYRARGGNLLREFYEFIGMWLCKC